MTNADLAAIDDASDDDRSDQDARQRQRLRLYASARLWWRRTFVKSVDQVDAIRRTKDESDLGGRYIFMTAMSAGIAVLGLILSSPAVVIGAMLLSPLMGPIIGAGFALAIWNVRWLRETGKSLFVGVVTAILIAALISWMSPIQNITTEIASRTRPNLLDLAVAFFSGLAGAYAMIRGRAGTIVGVAIAVALMPPLAVVGFGLATWNWTVFGGALMLFITNLVTIAVTAAFMGRLYGFKTTLSKQHTLIQSLAIAFSLVLLAIPLTLSLIQIRDEAQTTRLANQALSEEFDSRARIDTPTINFESDPIAITSAVFTPVFREDAERRIERRLGRQLGRPVAVSIEQFRVPVDAGAAQEAELAAARSRAQAEASQRSIDELTDRLALVSGVGEADITVDRDRRRAIVRARPIDGASLAAYRDLERRVASRSPAWSVIIVPPARPLPDIAFNDTEVSDPDTVTLAAWAQQRVGAPVIVTGTAAKVETVRKALAAAGARDLIARNGNGDTVKLAWAAPDAQD